MPGGRADFYPVRPWDLAAQTFVFSTVNIGVLLVIMAFPELVRVAMFVAHDVLMRSSFQAWVTPPWITNLLSNAISGVAFTGIIRFVVGAEAPLWLPARALLRHYLLTAAILIVMWVVIAFIANGVFSSAYIFFFTPDVLNEVHTFWCGKAYDWSYFVVSALLIAAFYPSLGMTAVRAEFDPHRLLRWWRRYYLYFLVLAALLMSVCLPLRRAYWWLLDTTLPGLTDEISFIGRETLRSLVVQMTEVPMDILFDIVPAVAIGLLFKALRANSVDL